MARPRALSLPTKRDDSPMEDEENWAYQKRRASWEEKYASMWAMSVMHSLGAVTMAWDPCKESKDCWAKMHTVGYKTVLATWEWWERKPWSPEEANACGCAHTPLQVLLEEDGEWNCTPLVLVDCTPLYRLLDHSSIHSGEHSVVIERMVRDTSLRYLLGQVKMAFALFLRQRPASDNKFEVMCIDPYGQNRSVAFARIVAYCLAQCHVAGVAPIHHSKGSWQEGCCSGDCEECTNSPMSVAKEAALQRAYGIWLAL